MAWAKSTCVRCAVTCTCRRPACGSTKRKRLRVPLPLVFVIVALRPPRLGRPRLPGLLNELLRGLIKVDLRPGGSIRLSGDFQDVFHRGDELRTHLWAAPLFLPPRLEDRFFHTRRTLTYDYDAARPSATTR